MKIILAHSFHSPAAINWYKEISATSPSSMEVEPFVLSLTGKPERRPAWTNLDRRWKRKDPALLRLYRQLQEACEDADALLSYNGAYIHPELLPALPTFTVYSCFDDPESSQQLSAPVAAHFDAVFYGNIAARFQYQNFGCKRLAHLPIFTAPSDLPEREDQEELLGGDRDIDISLVCERLSHYRTRRLDALVEAFPQAKCYGRGWENGEVTQEFLDQLYRRTRIGWNIHNSTGPVNRRTHMLPAYGILQVCDNKTGLGHLYRLGEEVVGFDTIPEAIELTKYYLNNDEKRREIALKGYERFWQNYHPEKIWEKIEAQLVEWGAARKPARPLRVPHRRYVAGVTSNLYVRQGVKLLKTIFKREKHKVAPHFKEEFYLGQKHEVYSENEECFGLNLAKQRLEDNLPLEWPNILATNWAITALIGDAKEIVEIGSGTGAFADFASVDSSRSLSCFEWDDFARDKAIELRARPNVTYYKDYEGNLKDKYDLLVSVEVIEHVKDTLSFLRFCKALAPRAVFTTPNRLAVRGSKDCGPPAYPAHVREYSQGEVYWLLKEYYDEVYLYHTPDYYVPWLEPLTISEIGHPLIAHCVGPRD